MSITININGLTLCHRGSGGVTHNTLPDVCKTPDKGIPLPYANEAYSHDLVKGTTTVFADGGNMIANYGSEFCKSVFDEGGSMGGIKSGTHLAEADWITHSFDVFFEGKAACRLTDKMFMNHRNTVNMSGLSQKALNALRKLIQDFVCECDKEIQPGKDDDCMSLGNKKHDCVEKKKEEDNKKRAAKGEKPAHGGEKGYKLDENRQIVREADGKPKIDDIAGRRTQKADNVSKARGALEKAQSAAKSASTKLSAATEKLSNTRVGKAGGKLAGSALKAFNVLMVLDVVKDVVYTSPEEIAILKEGDARRAAEQAALEAAKAEADLAKAEAQKIMRRDGYRYPDGAILDEDGKIREISEYKFRCPKDTPTGRSSKKTGKRILSKGKSKATYTPGKKGMPGQKEDQKDILDGLIQGGEATGDAELNLYNNVDC